MEAVSASKEASEALTQMRHLMCAFGGKADMTDCGNPLLRSLLGAKRTSPFALQMSANDPKRTFELGWTPISASQTTERMGPGDVALRKMTWVRLCHFVET